MRYSRHSNGESEVIVVDWTIICFLYDQLVAGEAKLARERWFGAFRELVTLNRFQRGHTEDDQTLVAMRNTDNPLIFDLAADNTAPAANDNIAVTKTLDLGSVCIENVYSATRFNVLYRDEIYYLYVVGGSFFLFLLNCSAWPCLGPALQVLQRINLISVYLDHIGAEKTIPFMSSTNKKLLQISRRYDRAPCSTHTHGGKGLPRRDVGLPTAWLTQITASTWEFLQYPHPI